MTKLQKVVAAHPLRKKPYHAIKFARLDGANTPLYTVAKGKKEVGAPEALRIAFEEFGGHCFHCSKFMPPQKMSHDCGRDHVRPKCDAGPNMLHNLVLSCGTCNRAKGGRNLIAFCVEKGIEYQNALDAHISNCIKHLGDA